MYPTLLHPTTEGSVTMVLYELQICVICDAEHGGLSRWPEGDSVSKAPPEQVCLLLGIIQEGRYVAKLLFKHWQCKIIGSTRTSPSDPSGRSY